MSTTETNTEPIDRTKFQPTTCRSCKAAIRWVLGLEEGAFMPLNVDPIPDGDWAVEDTEDGPQLVPKRLATTDLFGEPLLYRSHWATCPDSKRWHEYSAAKRAAAGPGRKP